MKYSVNAFSRILLGLLAVFYVSIFAIEALHTHESDVETVSSDGEKNGTEPADCKICAYFAHYENELIAVSAKISFTLLLLRDDPFSTPELTNWYQTRTEDFINRGPPCPFV